MFNHVKFIISSFLYVFVIVSCNNTEHSDEGIRTLTIVPTSQKTISVEDVFSSYKYVNLHNDTSAIYLNVIQNVKIKNDNICLSDGESIMRFDMTGKLLNKISKLGAGHDEYKAITNFIVDTDNTVWVLNRHASKLIHYDWDGKMLNSIKLNAAYKDFCKVDDNHFILYKGNELDGNGDKRLVLYDINENKEIKSFLDVNEYKAKYLFVTLPGNICQNDFSQNSWHFDLYNDTIYKIEDGDVKPYFYLKFTNHQIPQELYEREFHDVRDFATYIQSNKYLYSTSIFDVVNDKVVLSYYQDRKMHIWIKALGNDDFIDFTALKDFSSFDGYTAEMIMFNNVFLSNNYLMFQIDVMDILDNIKKKYGDKIYDEKLTSLNCVDISGTFLFVGKIK